MEERVLNQNQALTVLIQAARIAQAKGAFTLEDASLVHSAIKVFAPDEAEESSLTSENNTQEDTPEEVVEA